MKNLKKPEWRCKGREIVTWGGSALAISGILAFFFYRSPWAVIPMMVPAIIYVWWENKKDHQKQDEYLVGQFAECILAVGNSVRAGYAVENAFLESVSDMKMMYGADAAILKELSLVRGGLNNHVPIEKLLVEMGIRTKLREVCEFAEVFNITKRNGGDLAGVMSVSAQSINNRRILKEEIQTLQSAKRLEQKIMNLIPLGLMIYMEVTAPGYFDMYFSDVGGRLIMTLFLLWYVGAYALSEYILWNGGDL